MTRDRCVHGPLDDVAGDIAEQDVPVNPVVLGDYPSVGCRPARHPAAKGADAPWAGSTRSECRIHARGDGLLTVLERMETIEGRPDPRQGGDVETPATDDEVINELAQPGEVRRLLGMSPS